MIQARRWWRPLTCDSEEFFNLTNFGDKLLNGPNDIWVRPDGGVYFTDPFYKRHYWKRGPRASRTASRLLHVTPTARLSRVSTPTKATQRHHRHAGRQDALRRGHRRGHDLRLRHPSPTATQEQAPLLRMGSDGMTIDDEGNVYLTGKGVTVFDKSGKKIEQIDVPELVDRERLLRRQGPRPLFITASGSVYGLKMRVKGAR